MLKMYSYPEFPYRQSAEQRAGEVRRHPLVIVGDRLAPDADDEARIVEALAQPLDVQQRVAR